MGLAFPKPTVTRDRIRYKCEREADLRAAIKEVWTRDASRCCACLHHVSKGSAESRWRGHVHHLVKRSQSKALRSVTSNMLLLCGGCHADVHTYRLVIHGTNANTSLRFERVTR